MQKNGADGGVPVGIAETRFSAAFVAVLLPSRSLRHSRRRRPPTRAVACPEPQPVLLAPPPMDDEFFPCSDCHEDEPTDRTVRKLEDEHDDLVLVHGTTWCLDCHDADQRDQLHLANDSRIGFEESWRLCTQCHGAKLADWRAGVHGKRTGSWWGPKEYRSCVTCHDPHSPRFESIEPMRPPARPEQIRLAAPTGQETADEEP
jgi:hypothetical protein